MESDLNDSWIVLVISRVCSKNLLRHQLTQFNA